MAVTNESTSYKNPIFENDSDNEETTGNTNQLSDDDLKRIEKNVVALNSENSFMDFDDILPLVGEFGKYQKILFFYMIPFAFFLVFVYFTQIFLTLTPQQYWCEVPELGNLTIQQRLQLSIPFIEGAYSKCYMYNVNYTEQLLNGVSEANSTWPMIACNQGWSYNLSEIHYASIATDLNWICEDAANATLAQSIFFLGAIVGGLLFGWIADKFGRIPSMIACNLLGCIAGAATAFVKTFWTFALLRFFVGFAFDNCFVMMFILVLEYVGPKYRTFISNMSMALFFTGGACTLPWIAYYVANWRLLAIVTSIPLLLVIFIPWLIPESARWLVCQGDIDKTIEILTKMAESNKKIVPPETFDNFRKSCLQLKENEIRNNSYTVIDLFRTPRLRRITILFIIIWMSTSLVFDGHLRNVGSFGLDLFVTFTIACLTELPGSILLTFTLDIVGRRWYACVSLAFSGIFSLLAAMVTPGIYAASFAIAGRFFVNISYNIGLQYAAEILPTVVRAQGVALIHTMGYIATIISPFVVYLSNISTVLPLVILGIVGVVSGLLCLLLPETLHKVLPKSLQDGEDFGLDQKFWNCPCIKKHEEEELKLGRQ